LTIVTIPEGVKEISHYMFNGSTGLKRLVLPEGVQTISYGAFSECSGLTELVVPSSLTEICKGALNGCDQLTIHCPKDSFAESYAKENNIPYVTI
jgi:hypothetical protein